MGWKILWIDIYHPDECDSPKEFIRENPHPPQKENWTQANKIFQSFMSVCDEKFFELIFTIQMNVILQKKIIRENPHPPPAIWALGQSDLQ